MFNGNSRSHLQRRDSVELVVANTDYDRVHKVDQTYNFSRAAFLLPQVKSDTNTNHHEETAENRRLQFSMLLLLVIVGVCAGFMNAMTLWLESLIMKSQAVIIASDNADWGPALVYLIFTTMAWCAVSSSICFKAATPAVVGSGIAEMKALLAGEFNMNEYPKIVSLKILLARTTGLITAMGSGMAIGAAAPLVHCSTCVAYVLMRTIPEFGAILESPSLAKQVFAAAAAVGVGSVFNAPVGGVLFSIEVTSSFYLMTNYWKGFLAATTGSIMYQLVKEARGEEPAMVSFNFPLVSDTFARWELLVFIIMGVFYGYFTILYLRINQKWFTTVRKTNVTYPVTTAVIGGFCVAILLYISGAYTDSHIGLAAIAKDAFLDGDIVDMRGTGLSRLMGLTFMFFITSIMVYISTNLRIPAGFFLPLFGMGAISGRFWGTALQIILGNTANIYIPGYAMVGAVAFLSGATQTISTAIIAVEITGETEILLPCLIVSVIASGICKSYDFSIYDQGMINKGLESLQLLLLECGGFHYANDVLNEKVTYTTRHCTVETLILLLEGNAKQNVFPVVSNNDSMKLIGSITRKDIYQYLKTVFNQNNVGYYLLKVLPIDYEIDEERDLRLKKLKERKNQKEKVDQMFQNKFKESTFTMMSNSLSHTKNYFNGVLSGNKALKNVDEGTSPATDVEEGTMDRYIKTDKEGLSDNVVYSIEQNPMISNIGPESIITVQESSSDDEAESKDEVSQKSEATITNLITEPKYYDDKKIKLPTTEEIVIAPSNTQKDSNTTAIPKNKCNTMLNKLNKAKETSQQLAKAVESSMKKVGAKPSRKAVSTEQQAADEPTIKRLLEVLIDIVQEPSLPINAFPFTAHGKSTMEHIYVLFEMVHVQCVFIVGDNRKLEGMISKDQLLSSLRKKIK